LENLETGFFGRKFPRKLENSGKFRSGTLKSAKTTISGKFNPLFVEQYKTHIELKSKEKVKI
jgi:hypothetical protein